MKEIDNKIVLYRNKKGNVELRADVEMETIWASINQIADIFGIQKAAISKHFKHIFEKKN